MSSTTAAQQAYLRMKTDLLETCGKAGAEWRKEFFYSPLVRVEPSGNQLTAFQANVRALRTLFTFTNGITPIEEIDRFAIQARWAPHQRKNLLTFMLTPKPHREAHESFYLSIGAEAPSFTMPSQTFAFLGCKTAKEGVPKVEAVALPNIFDHMAFSIRFKKKPQEDARGAYSTFSVDLTAMKLTKLPSSFGKLPLTVLSMTFNNFNRVPPQVAKLKMLRKLDLQGNRITSKEGSTKPLRELRHLRELNMRDNQLSCVPLELIGLSIQKLYLDRNAIQTTGLTLTPLLNLRRLEVLTLSGNRLTRTRGFEKLVGLRGLDVSKNSEEVCSPEELKQLHLEYLNGRVLSQSERERVSTSPVEVSSTPSTASAASPNLSEAKVVKRVRFTLPGEENLY